MANKWLERELEDYVAADPYRLIRGLRGDDASQFEVGIVGRQIKCRYGIIDMLLYSTHREMSIPVYTITLVEFKAVEADKKTAEQVMRYMMALEEVGIYDAVPAESFFDYAHMVDSYLHFESTIVAPSFADAISWYPNRVIATRNEQGFSFSFDTRIKGNRRDNDDLQAAMMPILSRVAESARIWHATQRLQAGLDSTETQTGNN